MHWCTEETNAVLALIPGLLFTWLYLKGKIWFAWGWVRGYILCLSENTEHETVCKRRLGHFGCHKTASGFAWKK